MIKLVVFDLWDTLAYRGTGYGSTAHLMKMTNSRLPREKFIKIFEKSLQTKKWRSKHAAYMDFCKNLGLPATRANIEMLVKTRDRAESRAKIFFYSIRMLKKLRKQGYKTGMISNTSIFAIQKIMMKTKLLDHIDYFLPSYSARMIKPDPRIFKKMLGVAKVEPREAIMVGDKINDDVLPARRMGMHAIHFTNYNELRKRFMNFKIHL